MLAEIPMDFKNTMRRDEMIEEILPCDIAQKLNRYQQDIFIPVRIKKAKEMV